MPASEVQHPIINSPYEEPAAHWKIHEHESAEKIEGRRKPSYLYQPPGGGVRSAKSRQTKLDTGGEQDTGYTIELELVSRIRERLGVWRELALRGEGGVSRVTMELLNYWRREGRAQRLFFAQLEAAETIIFLTEARADLLQGLDVPLDEPSGDKNRDDFTPLRRLCCKMATGAGKTTVMAMLAAWSVLNKVNNKRDQRFSDAVLVVCPNVTIRDRLAELDPQKGEASLYRTRDLVPRDMMPQLAQGRVMTVNWHVFEPRNSQSDGRVVKSGRAVKTRETIEKKPGMTEADFRLQTMLEKGRVLKENKDKDGVLVSVEIESSKYIETDTAIVRRVLEGELGARRNLLVFNDEAHHAYRLHATDGAQASDEGELIGDSDAAKYYYKEATVWVEGLDKVNQLRNIQFCVDFSATPYFLGKAGDKTNHIFPWTVSDFGLQDAIESGLVKIPQLAVRDSTGKDVPGYFNIWNWILPKLSVTERGGKRGQVKPEAVLRYAHTPIAMLGGKWEQLRQTWDASDETRPPVFILVCKTKKLAKMVYEWLAEDKPPSASIPTAHLPELLNSETKQNTICVYSDVQKDIDSGNAKSEENRWMRYTLATIGKTDWPQDRQKRAQYPDGFEELADKLGREKHPPGRDIRCIISVGMLTEGWDCSTVTHIIGLRPFMSQLLCEQVIGRGLRRASYEVGEDGLMREEIATVLGVPLTAFTVKAPGNGEPPEKRHHIYALPARADFEICFPRVEGYRQTVRNRVVCDMEKVPPLPINGYQIPPEVEMRAALANNEGRLSLHGPGDINRADLQGFREQMRLQGRICEMTLALTKEYGEGDDVKCKLPMNFLFVQLYEIVRTYITDKVSATPPADLKDAFLSPYYGWIIEQLRENIRPDETAGEAPELPRYERSRDMGSTADVDFYTSRKPYPILKSHVNALTPDTKRLEQRAAYHLDNNPQVFAYVKNDGMGFGIPYFHNNALHDYMPDFIVRLHPEKKCYLILETKGFDPLKKIKQNAAERWVDAVNNDGKHGHWQYKMVFKAEKVDPAIRAAAVAADVI